MYRKARSPEEASFLAQKVSQVLLVVSCGRTAPHLMNASDPSTMLSKGLMQAVRVLLTGAGGASYSMACCSCRRRKHSSLLGRLNAL